MRRVFAAGNAKQGGMVTHCCVTMCPDWLMVTQRRVTMPPS